MGVPGNVSVRVCVCGWVCVWKVNGIWKSLKIAVSSCSFSTAFAAGRVNNCNALLSCLKLRRRYFCIFHAEFCLCAPNWHETHDVWIATSVCICVCVCLWLFLVPLPTHVSDLKTHFVCQFLHCTTTTFSHFPNFPHFLKIFYELFPYFNENNKKGMGSFPLIISGCQLSAAFPSNCIYKYVSYL